MSEQENGPRTWGGTVDDVIHQSLYGNTGEPVGDSPFGGANGQGSNDPVKATVAALTVIERHIHPVRPEDLGALALLRVEAALLGPDGDVFSEIANHWQATHHLRGSAGALLSGLEAASAMRQFKGTTGSIVRGVGGPGQAGGGGGRR